MADSTVSEERLAVPEREAAVETASYAPEPELGVSIRSRPPIFFFWPTLAAALLLTSVAGLLEKQEPLRGTGGSSPVQAGGRAANAKANLAPPAMASAGGAAQGTEAGAPVPSSLSSAQPWGRRASLGVLFLCSLVMVAYALAHLFFYWSNPSVIGRLHHFAGRPLAGPLSLLDLFCVLLVVFLLLQPSYGLLALLAFYAFGLMTDHEMFTKPQRLRWGMILVIAAILVAILRELLLGQRGQAFVWRGAASDGGTLAAFFFVLWAFNMFVLAFDFNGSSLLALIAVIVALIAVIVMCNLLFPTLGVGDFFLSLLGSVRDLRVNSAFYQAWAYLISALMVFSGFIAKADFWQITPTAIIHHQGLLVQRSRHYGALVNFHYHVEFPDFFEHVLGGGAGTFVLSLPREERPEVVEHVWYARYYNQQIQQVLAELPTDPN